MVSRALVLSIQVLPPALVPSQELEQMKSLHVPVLQIRALLVNVPLTPLELLLFSADAAALLRRNSRAAFAPTLLLIQVYHHRPHVHNSENVIVALMLERSSACC